MRIEEGEAIFGKRWNYWTDEEQAQFMSVITIEELLTPLCLNWAIKHETRLPPEVRDWVVQARKRAGQGKLLLG